MDMILQNKVLKNHSFSKISITKTMLLNWYSPMKKIEKDSDNIWHIAIFHSIKLPFDAEVAEKLLNGI